MKLLLVGCGHLGGAMLERIAGRNHSKPPFSAITVVKPSPPSERLKSLPGVTWLSGPEKIDPEFKPDLIVLAFKPQQMSEVLPAYARFRESVFLSIAAGTTIARLGQLLGSADVAVVRTIPNMPASIGEGITPAIPNAKVSPAQRSLCDLFLKASGHVVWLEDENLMDVAAALSASSPTFVFALCESLAKAGEALGVAPEIAMQLARQTVIGSSALLARSNESAEGLRRYVTTPNGMTEAALKHILGEHNLDEMILKAVTAGAQRAKELTK